MSIDCATPKISSSGSIPGVMMKMSGDNGDESLKTLLRLSGGGVTNSSPRAAATKTRRPSRVR